MAIIFAVTGVSPGQRLVSDISDGYFDRLLLTPISRLALLLGLMVADFVLIIALSIPVIIMGWITGVSLRDRDRRDAGLHPDGGAVGPRVQRVPVRDRAQDRATRPPSNASFILFFPFAFLTTAFVPRGGPAGWLATVARYNPVTYLLAGLRSLITGAGTRRRSGARCWRPGSWPVSLTLALTALRGRVANG